MVIKSYSPQISVFGMCLIKYRVVKFEADLGETMCLMIGDGVEALAGEV